MNCGCLIIIFFITFLLINLYNILLVATNRKDYKNLLKIMRKKKREYIGYILNRIEYRFGLEIGVQKGVFTNKLLNIWKLCSEYTMIDPWIQQIYYDDGANVNQEKQNMRFFEAMKIVAKYSNRTYFKIFRTKSEIAYKSLPYNSYDFIYIDGRHDYYSVKNDIKNYFPVLKRGGLLCGDDYSYSPGRWRLFPDGTIDNLNKSVKGAVDEFVKRNKLDLFISIDMSWCLIKQ